MLAVTGHRPDKLGGYTADADLRLRTFARLVLPQLLAATRTEHVITGMALGWDQAVALACVDLKVPYTAAVPFPEQDSRWPEASRIRWASLCAQAHTVVTVTPAYSGANLQRRNEWMVDHGSALAALWNGTSGGTANCVGYAQRRGAPVIGVWQHWHAFLHNQPLPPIEPLLISRPERAGLAQPPQANLF